MVNQPNAFECATAAQAMPGRITKGQAHQLRNMFRAETKCRRSAFGELVLQLNGDYDGIVVAELRDGLGEVNALLVDIGGKKGRLALHQLRGTVDPRSLRQLWRRHLRVRVIHINKRGGLVLSERLAAAA